MRPSPARTSSAPTNRTDAGPSRFKHARRIKNQRALYGAVLALTGILAFSTAGLGAAATRLTGNIEVVDLDAVIAHERPALPTEAEIVAAQLEVAPPDEQEPAAEVYPELLPVTKGAPMNILIMGTDDRSGENGALGGSDASGARSDSTLILHISANRDWIAAVSIPRDTIVNIPSCPTSSGKYTAARPLTRFNAAFAYGALAGRDVASGALCTLTTVEAITNIRMDGFVVLDFVGFKNMVDALGGIEVDIPNRIKSPLAENLELDAGLQTLDGWQALQYARARTGQGLASGSDLDRIRRQQTVIAAIAHQVHDTNLLTDSAQLFRFLNATTSSLTTSSNFATINGMAELASVMSAVEVDNIEFIMAPVRSNPENPNTVLFSHAAKDLWAALRFDNRPQVG